MQEQSDQQLMASWKEGDPLGFEALAERYQGALLSHARILMGFRQGAEDAVQDAFLKFAHRPPELPVPEDCEPGGQGRPLAAWLHTVTRNGCMDRLRSESRRRQREQSAAQREASRGGLEHVEAEDTRKRVERGLERLPEEQREVLVLRLFGDRSYREIASITGKRVGTIGWLISTGMQSLSRELAPIFAPHHNAPGGASRASMQGGRS